MLSSPRPWGCFRAYLYQSATIRLFPTPVGVFPLPSSIHLFPFPLPHARGGVSSRSFTQSAMARSSPRPWGCFPSEKNHRKQIELFPTHVGVFPRTARSNLQSISLPHARGGVSAANSFSSAIKPSSPRPGGCFLHFEPRQPNAGVFPTPVGVFLKL